jgi:hypothetical protein
MTPKKVRFASFQKARIDFKITDEKWIDKAQPDRSYKS